MKYLTFTLLFAVSSLCSAQTIHIIANSTATCGSSTGDGGDAQSATINFNGAVASDSASNIYFSDGYSVRKVNNSDGIVTTIAGIADSSGYSGDGGPAVDALFRSVQGLAYHNNNLYVSDYNNSRLRKIDLSTGIISTVIGNGTASVLGTTDTLDPLAAAVQPGDIDIDNMGNIYFTNLDRQIIKYDQSINKVYPLISININRFYGITVNKFNSDIYYVHRGDTICEIKKLVPSDYSNPICFGGIGLQTFSGDGGPATSASFNGEWGIALSPDTATLYIGDRDNRRIRAIDMSSGIVNTYAGSGANGTVTSSGGSALQSPITLSQFIKTAPNGNLLIPSSGCQILEIRPAATHTNESSINSESFKFYPNPSNGSVNFESENVITEFEILNSTGQIVYRQKFNTNKGQISFDLDAGFYLINAKNEDGKTYVSKLIIQK